VGLVTLSQAESAGKVTGKECLLLDRRKESLVDGLLVGGTASGGLLLLWLLALLEECLFSSLLLTLSVSKVLVSSYLIDLGLVNTCEIDLLGSCDNVASIDSAERNTVDLEWASDEENTLGDVLEENNTLAAETTSEEDEHGTWGKSRSGNVGLDGLADLLGGGLVLSWVPFAGLLAVVRDGSLRLAELLGGVLWLSSCRHFD